MLSLSRFTLPASLLVAVNLAVPQMALAFEESDTGDTASVSADQASSGDDLADTSSADTVAPHAEAAAPHSLPQETKAEEQQAAAPAAPEAAAAPAAPDVPQSQSFVSDGTPFHLDSLGITIAPPQGWQVETNTGNLSLVMSEPHDPRPSYDKPKYQRNITVAAIHEPSPIDEKRALQLQDELTKRFSADGSVSNFQIVEHKFFNYRGTNDGLLVYSSMNVGDYPMMQMHVLVSGKDQQFLLTYTDLADNFTNGKDGMFEKAWNSIVSIEVTGETPTRQSQYLKFEIAGGIVALLGLAAFLLRRRAKRQDFSGEADAMADSGEGSGDLSGSLLHTLAHGWRLDAKAGDEVSGIEFTGAEQPVSNY